MGLALSEEALKHGKGGRCKGGGGVRGGRGGVLVAPRERERERETLASTSPALPLSLSPFPSLSPRDVSRV